MSLDQPSVALSTPSEAADDLTATNSPDLLTNEQTWPTDDEMVSNNGVAGSDGRHVKRVPKGTSAYQAAWIIDNDDDESGDEEEEGGGVMDIEGDLVDGANDTLRKGDEEEEETEEVELDSRRGETHRDLDPEQEEAEFVDHNLVVEIF